MESLEDRRVLAVITVDTIVDERDFDISPNDDVSLRDAVLEAAPGDVICFDSSLNGQTIELLSGLGDIDIDEDLTINGTDPSGLPLGITIDAQDNSRIFNITGGAATNVVITDLRLINGDVRFDNGGAIYANSNLTLKQVVIENQ